MAFDTKFGKHLCQFTADSSSPYKEQLFWQLALLEEIGICPNLVYAAAFYRRIGCFGACGYKSAIEAEKLLAYSERMAVFEVGNALLEIQCRQLFHSHQSTL